MLSGRLFGVILLPLSLAGRTLIDLPIKIFVFSVVRT